MTTEPRFIIHQFADASKKILRNNAVEEYLFGSYATRTQTPLSDIDILIIVKTLTPAMQSQISGIASDYALKYDLCISPILTDIKTWIKNKKSNLVLSGNQPGRNQTVSDGDTTNCFSAANSNSRILFDQLPKTLIHRMPTRHP